MLNCGSDAVISSVFFADYGLPHGDCSAGFKPNPQCTSSKKNGTAPSPADIVAHLCVGKHHCSVRASNQEFSNVCDGTCKKLAVQIECTATTPLGGAAATTKHTARASQPTRLPHEPLPQTFNCYADNAPGDHTMSQSVGGGAAYTSATGTSLASLAKLPGSALGVLNLVPFLRARQARQNPAAAPCAPVLPLSQSKNPY